VEVAVQVALRRARSRIRCLALVQRGAGANLGGVGVQEGSEEEVMGIICCIEAYKQ